MPQSVAQVAEVIPGICQTSGGVALAWDALPALGRMLRQQMPSVGDVAPPIAPYAGLEKFLRLNMQKRLRPYQLQMCEFVARRAYAIDSDSARSGKTCTLISAATLVGAEKVLVVGPAMAKLVWATEIAKWTGEAPLILYGRSASEARVFCVPCMGTGSNADGSACKACARHGSFGWASISKNPGEVQQALQQARWVIVNYDLLIGQMGKDAAGKALKREHLPGWAQTLSTVRFDVAIGDEAQLLRGRSDAARKGLTRRERFIHATDRIERVWCATATPIYGRTADLWGLLDALTRGLFGRPAFSFDRAYAGGHKGEWGWENGGHTSQAADDELVERLSYFMLKRTRSEIYGDLPPKTRQIVYVESNAVRQRSAGKRGVSDALRATAVLKVDTVVENTMTDIMSGEKAVVFTYLRANAEALVKAFKKAASAKDIAPRMRAVNFAVWAASGDQSNDARFRMAEAFRNWQGAGVLVATIDSMQVAISLKGATSVHFADMHYDPAALLQAEDRPYDSDIRGLAILYYVVRGSVDEHVIASVLPKMETLEKLVNEEGAESFRAAFNGNAETPEQIAASIWAKMVAMESRIQA